MATDQDVAAFLEHYGVRGMHWGQRKPPDTSPLKVKYNSEKASYELNRKPTTSDIYSARQHINETRNKIAELNKKPTSQYTKEDRQRDKADGIRSPVKQKYRNTKEHAPLLREALDSTDATVALYKTRGEQIVAGLLLGPAGAYRMRNTKGGLKSRSSEQSLDKRYKVRQ